MTRQEIADALEVEQTQAGRFIREMVRAGWIYRSWCPEKRGQKCEVSLYSTTPVWHEAAKELKYKGVLPDVCEWEGCAEPALPFRYRKHFWCAKHLQERHCKGCMRKKENGQCPKDCEEADDEHRADAAKRAAVS